MANSCPW